MICGSGLIPFGAIVFTLLTPSCSPIMAGLGSLVMGFGMGLLSVCSLILIQEIVDYTQRGSVTSSNVFSRNLGSMLGATVFGAVFNYGLMHAKGMADVLQSSLHNTFILMFVISLTIVVLTSFVPYVEIGKAKKLEMDLPPLE
jgi:MFS family permease